MTTYGPYTFDTQNDADCQEFTFTSTNGGSGQTTAGVISAAGTAAEFCHDTNGGNSTNVGPDQGQGGSGDGYLYTECSSPGAASDTYTMTFDTTLDASAEQWQFNFYTCQRGPAIGNNQSTCVVQINESGGGWTTVTGGSFGGSGQDTTDGTAWTSRSVDLSDSGANTDSSTQVRLLITTVAATVWHGDYGIDTVTITGTPTGSKDQEGYRWRDDDGSESTATWSENQDTDHDEDFQSTDNIRLRILTDYDGDPDAEAVQLEYKEVGDLATEWRKVPSLMDSLRLETKGILTLTGIAADVVFS